jgi:hypothetical protein
MSLAGVLLAVLAAATVLTACQKPAPNVSVLSGSTFRTVSPSTYCFAATTCRPGPLDLPEVSAAPDSKVLVDVPRQVMSRGWAVLALSLNGRKVLGTSGRITDSHSYQIASTVNSGQPFIVEVRQFSNGKPDSSRWSFLVKISGVGQA